MPFCKNHKFLYFDTLRRTKKAEAVLCLIHASYQSQLHNGDKNDIVRMLKNAYELYMFDAGTYTGESESQFSSQYTIGHELGIWLNSNLELNELAIKVAKNDITIKDYFDIVFLNYIQPIDEKLVHPLYESLVYLKVNSKTELTKNDMDHIFDWVSEPDKNNVNGFYNMLLGTSYFTAISNDTLHLEYPVDILMNCCNLEYKKLSLEEANVKFSSVENYVKYLIKDYRTVELMSYRFNQNLDMIDVDNNDLVNNTNVQHNNENLVGFNKIYYGIPGCGKSYKVSSMLKYKDGFTDEANKNGIYSKVNEDNIIRTTFYLDYSNSDFVGQIYPVVDDDGKVTYESIPGPFTKALVRAYMHPDQMVYLVIEEINRGNAAAIFGDLFQLLDRVKKSNDGKIKGESEYPITNEFIEGYLKKIVRGKIDGLDGDISRLSELSNHNIIIPNNLTIFATMNTSDQNVFPLDTAFKRRWNRERVKVDWEKVGNKYKLPILNKCIPFTDMTWGNFASNVNIKMVEDCKDGIITQDKNLGPFFVDEELLVDAKDRYNPENKEKLIQFTNNVIDYLFLDVTKFDHDVLFEARIKYSEVYDYFTESVHSVVATSQDAKRYLKIFANKISDDVVDELSRGNGNDLGESVDGDSEER